MSNLRVNTISDLAGTGPVTLTKQSAAKAWASVNSASVVLGSFNVSSNVDFGTADYALNFTSAFADVDYVPTSSGPVVSTTAYVTAVMDNFTYRTQTTSRYNYVTGWAGTGGVFAYADMSSRISIQGDLA